MNKLTRCARALARLPLDPWQVRRLARQVPTWHLPQHVGLILDGNRRFARSHGFTDVLEGHARGADKLYEVLRWFYDANIRIVTIWIFSTENFGRPTEEVQGLLSLIERKAREMVDHPDVHRNAVRVRFIGRTHLLPPSLREAVAAAEAATAGYSRNYLNVAIAYGGREEIADAFRQYLLAHSANGTTPGDLAAKLGTETLDPFLYTAGQPDPDLIIRTSGEVRLSGFLLWQSAYAEYYFCDSYWPEFRYLDFLRALRAYHRRQRRYGK